MKEKEVKLAHNLNFYWVLFFVAIISCPANAKLIRDSKLRIGNRIFSPANFTFTNMTNLTNLTMTTREPIINIEYSISYPINNISMNSYDLEKDFIMLTKNRTVDHNTVYISKKFCNFKNLKTNKTLIKINVTDIKANLTTDHNKTSSSKEYFNFNFDNRVEKRKKLKIPNNINHNKTLHSNSTIGYSSDMPDYLLSVIADQSEAIKKEICLHCLEILEALNFLVGEIKIIKGKLKKLTTNKTNATSKEKNLKVAHLINNINYVKADLFKLNEILKTLQKADCPNFLNNSKRYRMVVNYTNKIVEIIQQSMKTLNIKLNLVILS
jgi:hypothetical protein